MIGRDSSVEMAKQLSVLLKAIVLIISGGAEEKEMLEEDLR